MIRSRRLSHGSIFLALVWAYTFCGTRQVAAAPTADQIDGWIVELGDNSYQVRKAAADHLAAGGLTAREALARVADGTDPEVRSTARRLLAVIDDSEFNRALAEFAADVAGTRGATLPGWKEFGELVGSDAAARALFVDMQREEGSLLARAFNTSTVPRDINWEAQVMRLMRARVFNQSGGEFSAPVGSSAALLFLGALDDSNVSDSGARSLLQLTQIPPLNESIAPNRPPSAARRLVAAWIVHCPNRSEMVLEQRLQVMIQQQLEDALPLALEIVERNPKYLTIGPALQMTALLAVGKLGSDEHLDAIEPLLEDRGELNVGQLNSALPGAPASIQVRDVALAVLLHLTEQEPLTYGFMHAQANPLMVFELRTLTLENDERRAAAIERWRDWRAKHKPPAARRASS